MVLLIAFMLFFQASPKHWFVDAKDSTFLDYGVDAEHICGTVRPMPGNEWLAYARVRNEVTVTKKNPKTNKMEQVVEPQWDYTTEMNLKTKQDAQKRVEKACQNSK